MQQVAYYSLAAGNTHCMYGASPHRECFAVASSETMRRKLADGK